MPLIDLPDYATDARHRADAENEEEANLGRPWHLELPQHDDGYGQETKVHDYMPDTKKRADKVY